MFGIKTDAPLIHTVKEGPAGVTVAIVSKEWGTEEEKEANSCLIAASPELLDVLENLNAAATIETCNHCFEQLDSLIRDCEKAIAKARGE